MWIGLLIVGFSLSVEGRLFEPLFCILAQYLSRGHFLQSRSLEKSRGDLTWRP